MITRACSGSVADGSSGRASAASIDISGVPGGMSGMAMLECVVERC